MTTTGTGDGKMGGYISCKVVPMCISVTGFSDKDVTRVHGETRLAEGLFPLCIWGKLD